MKKKLILASFFIILLSSILVSACSKSNDKAADSTPVATATPAEVKTEATAAPTANMDPLGKYDPPITIKTVRRIDANMKLPEGQTYEDNVWTRALSEELGINVKVDWSADGTQYDTELNVTMASGALPDIMRVDEKQLQQLIETDSIADLTEVYNQYASEATKEQYGVGDSIALKQSSSNGKLYALPNSASSIAGAGGPLIWVRSDWMKNLNLPDPKNMDDLLNIMKAFTNDDPDGNNKKDTFGFTVSKNFLEGGYSATGIFNGYHAYPKDVG